MDIRWNMFLTMTEICKQEGVELETFNVNANVNARASPSKKDPKILKKIREEYKNFLSSFSSEKSLFIFDTNGNSKKYPEEKKDKLAKDIKICFGGAFREFLKDIKRKYLENNQKIKNCLKSK